MKIEDIQPTNDFTRIEWERQNKADQHWWAMTRRFDTSDYTKWWDYLEYPDGNKTDFCHEPLPRGNNYERVFYGRIFNEVAHSVLPYLESAFEKDEPDLVYIEGLLLSAEELGLEVDGTVYLISGECATSLWKNVSPDQRERVDGYGYGSGRFIGGPIISKRIEVIRGWIKQVRKANKKASTVETHGGQAPAVPAEAPASSVSPFSELLLKYSLAELTALLTNLGLLDAATGKATPAASPGAWVGVIYALLEAEHPRLKGSKAAIWRAFSSTFAAVGSERAVQNGLGTRGSAAEQFRDRTLAILTE